MNEKLDIAYSLEELEQLEERYICLYDSMNPNKGYNKRHGGTNGTFGEGFSLKMSEITKGALNGMYGKHHSEETKNKIRESRKAIEKYGEEHPNYGKVRTEETRNKISKTRKEIGLAKGESNPMHGISPQERMDKETYSKWKQSIVCKGERNGKSKKVKCVNTGEVFISTMEAGLHFGFKNGKNVARVARGERKHVGHPVTKERLMFEYIVEE